MPKHVTKAKQSTPIVTAKHFAVLVQIGNVVDVHRQAPLVASGDITSRFFHRPEICRKEVLLLIIDDLMRNDQHAVDIHRVLDRGGVARRHTHADVDAGDAAREVSACRVDGFNGE